MTWPAWTRPVAQDVTTRDGVRLAYAVHGSGPATVVLMPTWAIAPSRIWKAQVPYLARHHRVVTFDGRGSGDSDRPAGASAYTDDQYVADTLAVMDATGVQGAVLVGLSRGVGWALGTAAFAPDRVQGVIGIGASYQRAASARQRALEQWQELPAVREDWGLYNRHVWNEGGYGEFVQFFFSRMFNEPHSTKQQEDCVNWAFQTTPEVVTDSEAGRMNLCQERSTPWSEVLGDVDCPVLLVHGSVDEIRPADNSRRLADRLGAALVVINGAGHGSMARQPVQVNRLIRSFVDRVIAGLSAADEDGRAPSTPDTRVIRRPPRPKRVLFLSSPIGLGHATRDLAIARALRDLRPELAIEWLSQDPVTGVLERAGERVHPASAHLANESAHIEAECGEHDLAIFESIRRMDDILVNNFMVLDEILDTETLELIVADEAWEIDHHLHENPARKRASFAWLTDFVGWLPMPEGGDREAFLTADYNAEMIEHRARMPWVRDRSIFVGDPEDVVPDTFGPGLPGIREWVQGEFEFAGYIGAWGRVEEEEREAIRARLDLRAGEELVVVAVGGSAVGLPMLRRILDTVPLLLRDRPSLRFLVVAGPRIDPAALPRHRGVQVVGYLPDLWRHLAACDAAVVQGGLTTCMELAAARRPFIYVPLRRHFEQNVHVPHRLDRYRAGRRLDYPSLLEPDAFAETLRSTLETPVRSLPVHAGGAQRAAGLLSELV